MLHLNSIKQSPLFRIYCGSGAMFASPFAPKLSPFAIKMGLAYLYSQIISAQVDHVCRSRGVMFSSRYN